MESTGSGKSFRETLEREKLEALAEFAAGAGHEINNPLAVISGRAQLLLRGETDPERRRGLALIHAQAMRVHEMIGDLIFFARPPAPQRKPTDLVELVDRALAELAPLAAEKQAELTRSGKPRPLMGNVDPAQIATALRALGKNAIEALNRPGRVDFALNSAKNAIEIRVTDTGPGFPPEALDRLFDPFYCFRQAGRGLGMGLPKTWQIVTQHGGTIAASNRREGGAMIVIRLPRELAK